MANPVQVPLAVETGDEQEKHAMVIKPWDEQTTDEKLDTLRGKVGDLEKRIDNINEEFQTYSRKIKKTIDDIIDDVDNLKAVSRKSP